MLLLKLFLFINIIMKSKNVWQKLLVGNEGLIMYDISMMLFTAAFWWTPLMHTDLKSGIHSIEYCLLGLK